MTEAEAVPLPSNANALQQLSKLQTTVQGVHAVADILAKMSAFCELLMEVNDKVRRN